MAEFMENSGRDEDTPEAWVSEQMSFVDESGNRVCRFRIEGRDMRTDRWRTLVNVYRKADDTPGSLTERLSKQAERTRMRYVQVSAWFTRGKVPVSLFGEWPVEVADDFETDDDDTTTASVHRDATTMLHEAGARMFRQSSQNNDRLMHALLAMVRAVLDERHARLKAYEDERESFMRERLGYIDAYQNLVTERDKSKDKKERNEALSHMGKTLTDAVAYKLTRGVHAGGSKYDTMLRILGGLGESFSEDQRSALDSVLTPHQRATLIDLLSDADSYVDKVEEYRKRKQAEAKKKAKAEAAREAEAHGSA